MLFFNALRESSLGIFAGADDSLTRIMSFDSIFLVLSFLLLYLINPHTTRCRRLMPKTCEIGLLLHNCHALLLHNLYYGDFYLLQLIVDHSLLNSRHKHTIMTKSAKLTPCECRQWTPDRLAIENQNVRNFPYPVRIRWSRQPNLVPFYLYNRIFECPENVRNDGFPDVRWSSNLRPTLKVLATSGIH